MCALVSSFIMERVIEIKGLSVQAFIGVPVDERAKSQKLCLDLQFAAAFQPLTLNEDLTATIDYAMVARRVKELAEMKARSLIETLADEIAEYLFAEFPLRWIEITVRKFILPDTDYVAVKVRREK